MKLIRFVIQIAYFEDKSAILDYPIRVRLEHSSSIHYSTRGTFWK